MPTIFWKRSTEPLRLETDDEHPFPVAIYNFPDNVTVPYAREAITVATSSIGLSAEFVTQGPAVRAVLSLETAQIRFAYDGDAPTSTAGHLMDPGDVITLEGAQSISRFRAIRTGGTSGVLTVTYEKAGEA